jgi:hypothetical protein
MPGAGEPRFSWAAAEPADAAGLAPAQPRQAQTSLKLARAAA